MIIIIIIIIIITIIIIIIIYNPLKQNSCTLEESLIAPSWLQLQELISESEHGLFVSRLNYFQLCVLMFRMNSRAHTRIPTSLWQGDLQGTWPRTFILGGKENAGATINKTVKRKKTPKYWGKIDTLEVNMLV